MKLLIGLGNPGEKYRNTRHNVGFMVIDALAFKIQNSKFKVQNCNLKFKISKKLMSEITSYQSSVILAKPQTFMNSSGVAVSALANFYHQVPSALYVIHDDLDIKLGRYKIQKGIGPKVHNGISSIEEKLGTKDFWRVRVGIDGRTAVGPEEPLARRGEEYVLQKFTDEERKVVSEVIDTITGELNKRLEI